MKSQAVRPLFLLKHEKRSHTWIFIYEQLACQVLHNMFNLYDNRLRGCCTYVFTKQKYILPLGLYTVRFYIHQKDGRKLFIRWWDVNTSFFNNALMLLGFYYSVDYVSKHLTVSIKLHLCYLNKKQSKNKNI